MRTLNVDQCAELLNTSYTVISELAVQGELPGAKIGKSWVFLEDDIVEYLRGEVRKQQAERQRNYKRKNPPAPKVDFEKADLVSSFSAIQEQSRGGRRKPTTAADLTAWMDKAEREHRAKNGARNK